MAEKASSEVVEAEDDKAMQDETDQTTRDVPGISIADDSSNNPASQRSVEPADLLNPRRGAIPPPPSGYQPYPLAREAGEQVGEGDRDADHREEQEVQLRARLSKEKRKAEKRAWREQFDQGDTDAQRCMLETLIIDELKGRGYARSE